MKTERALRLAAVMQVRDELYDNFKKTMGRNPVGAEHHHLEDQITDHKVETKLEELKEYYAKIGFNRSAS